MDSGPEPAIQKVSKKKKARTSRVRKRKTRAQLLKKRKKEVFEAAVEAHGDTQWAESVAELTTAPRKLAGLKSYINAVLEAGNKCAELFQAEESLVGIERKRLVFPEGRVTAATPDDEMMRDCACVCPRSDNMVLVDRRALEALQKQTTVFVKRCERLVPLVERRDEKYRDFTAAMLESTVATREMTEEFGNECVRLRRAVANRMQSRVRPTMFIMSADKIANEWPVLDAQEKARRGPIGGRQRAERRYDRKKKPRSTKKK